MIKIKISLILVVAALMTACAGVPRQPTLTLSPDFYSNKDGVVGIYMNKLPAPDTHLVGASCLLCYAAASAANSSLTSHITSLSAEDLDGMSGAIEAKLKDKGIKTRFINTAIEFEVMEDFADHKTGFSHKDLKPLRESLGVDKLIVVSITSVGAYRPYSGYIPTGDPVGVVTGIAYTVDLKTNKYEQYESLDFKVNTEGEWDEPPAFAGVTNAYYQAIDN